MEVEVRCPRCGERFTAVPGRRRCPRCGAEIYVPPPGGTYDGCTAKTREAEELLEKIRKRGATPLEETLLEYYFQVGLIVC